MKTAFIITSAIEVDNKFPLTYTASRSHFQSAERFRQTIFTIAAIDLISSGDTATDIFLLDVSRQSDAYRRQLSYQQNLKYISVLEEFPEIHKTVSEHPNKSHCESLILLKFFEKYRTQLTEYDYIFKISGRYFTDSSFDYKMLTTDNLDKIFFKNALQYEWIDGYHPPFIDRRKEQEDNTVRMYSSVLYGFGKVHIDKFLDMFRFIKMLTEHPNGSIYYMEQMLYFLTRGYESKIVEVDWKVYGWDGTNGNFLRY
jgi:hypothetical protein